jgi:uncharacterized membrane protein YeiH
MNVLIEAKPYVTLAFGGVAYWVTKNYEKKQKQKYGVVQPIIDLAMLKKDKEDTVGLIVYIIIGLLWGIFITPKVSGLGAFASCYTAVFTIDSIRSKL